MSTDATETKSLASIVSDLRTEINAKHDSIVELEKERDAIQAKIDPVEAEIKALEAAIYTLDPSQAPAPAAKAAGKASGPRKPSLTPERVEKALADLFKEAGDEGVTKKALADALGAAPATVEIRLKDLEGKAWKSNGKKGPAARLLVA